MKKIVLFVATIVAVSLASCGGNKANNEESTKAAQNLKDSVAAVAPKTRQTRLLTLLRTRLFRPLTMLPMLQRSS